MGRHVNNRDTKRSNRGKITSMSLYKIFRKTNFYMFCLRDVLVCSVSPTPKKNAVYRLWGRFETYCLHPVHRYIISADGITEEDTV